MQESQLARKVSEAKGIVMEKERLRDRLIAEVRERREFLNRIVEEQDA